MKTISPMTDEAIIQLYLDRDECAILETNRKYRNYLQTIAQNILNDQLDCDECLSDTYLKVWNSIPPAMPKVFRAFLAKITRNTALDRRAAAARQKRVPAGLCDSLTDLEGVLPQTDTMESILDSKMIASIISDFLHHVSDRKLYIFISRYYYLSPISQIATKLHVSQSTVSKELASMKKTLRQKLKNGGIDL